MLFLSFLAWFIVFKVVYFNFQLSSSKLRQVLQFQVGPIKINPRPSPKNRINPHPPTLTSKSPHFHTLQPFSHFTIQQQQTNNNFPPSSQKETFHSLSIALQSRPFSHTKHHHHRQAKDFYSRKTDPSRRCESMKTLSQEASAAPSFSKRHKHKRNRGGKLADALNGE
jgi:hypothetical protein